jgi:hypothetical protein
MCRRGAPTTRLPTRVTAAGTSVTIVQRATLFQKNHLADGPVEEARA